MSLMGVDVGTTGVKAVVFDMSGGILASAYQEYPLLFPFPGAAELDSGQIIESALNVIGRVSNAVRDTDPVSAIGIASQGEAFTPIASDGSLLGNMMTSSDSRAAGIVDSWDSISKDRLYHITGHTPYPMYSLYKLLWMKQHSPEKWQKTWKFLFAQDLIAYMLTEETATDYTMAARSMLFDVVNKRWSKEILDAVGLSVDQLPTVLPPGGVVGTVKADQASALGLQSDVTVSVCGHDQPVGALGCGAASPGRASYSIGTVECICPSVDKPIFSPELMNGNLATYPHVLPNVYTTVAFNITGGSVLKWVRDNLAIEEAREAQRLGEDPYDRIIASASSDPSKLILLPHFGPTGTPHFDPIGAGVLFGMQLSTDRAEVIRAVLEGITYEIAWNLSILDDAGFKLSELRVIGGGAKSERWMQIKADILGVPLTTMRVTESTCMGAAILAGSGKGILDAAETSERWAVPVKTYIPDAGLTAKYMERLAIYKEIYNSLGTARRMLQDMKGES
ncbi:MAG: FGGY-family carbohydrate kinase [Armatimonadota bacterium]